MIMRFKWYLNNLKIYNNKNIYLGAIVWFKDKNNKYHINFSTSLSLYLKNIDNNFKHNLEIKFIHDTLQEARDEAEKIFIQISKLFKLLALL